MRLCPNILWYLSPFINTIRRLEWEKNTCPAFEEGMTEHNSAYNCITIVMHVLIKSVHYQIN